MVEWTDLDPQPQVGDPDEKPDLPEGLDKETDEEPSEQIGEPESKEADK